MLPVFVNRIPIIYDLSANYPNFLPAFCLIVPYSAKDFYR